ncbi:MAG: right-handed parallel beta-helix repeat-containing protein [Verrucomicrobia bacterium]|nr:right-handed parallel beta-helix repeat-containing protein [Verrucomicrobiota bacterium]
MKWPLLILWGSLAGGSGGAATFHCDPVKGGPDGDGSAERPWGRIEEVVAAGRIRFYDAEGRCANPSAPCGPGDTLLLRSGWHGVIHIRRGYNERPITIAAEPGHTPQVGWVEIDEGANWVVRGLAISPSLAPQPLERPPPYLVMLGEHGGEQSHDLVIEDCFVYTALDSSKWGAAEWLHAANGIWLGRRGRGHAARNNYVLNTRFGIALCAPGCVAEGNVVANFSADGIRITRDEQAARFNVVKNVFVSARDGDPNHDDGIQAFLFNVGRGTLRKAVVEGNIILERETDGLPLPNSLQGIGFFDGPLVEFVVRDNVVGVTAYHGITLGDARDCLIEGNTCYGANPTAGRPWIMVGRKRRDPVGNTVRNNWAPAFHLKDDAQVKAENNRKATHAIFAQRLEALADRINKLYGAVHPVARRPRLEPRRKRGG